MSDSLRPHELQHARLPCPSPTPRVCSNSCPLSQWCHPTISSSVALFSHHQALPSIRVFSSELALCIRWPEYLSFSISPSKEYSGLISFRIDWFDLLAVHGTLKSSPALQFKSVSSSALSLLYGPALTSIRDYWKNHSFDYMDLCWQVISLLFNTLSRFVIVFLPRSKHLWLFCLLSLDIFTITQTYLAQTTKSP